MNRPPSLKIGILAPASQVPRGELTLGVERLQELGFPVEVHPQCQASELFFAGSDTIRSQAFIEFAQRPDLSILWAARGGYGSIRILPALAKWTQKQSRIPEKKLLVGYSDITALMEFVRTRWGWPTLHASTPGHPSFSLLPFQKWKTLLFPQKPTRSFQFASLQFWFQSSLSKKKALRGELRGGNLTLWSSLVGTPYAPSSSMRCSFLFLEEVHEPLYRLDRMVQQLALSGTLDHVQAILLGNFLNCRDVAPRVLKGSVLKKALNLKNLKHKKSRLRQLLIHPHLTNQKPLRTSFRSQKEGLQRIFGELGQQRNLTIAFGLPVGHGPEQDPLPLGGSSYELTPNGIFQLKNWNWWLRRESNSHTRKDTRF